MKMTIRISNVKGHLHFEMYMSDFKYNFEGAIEQQPRKDICTQNCKGTLEIYSKKSFEYINIQDNLKSERTIIVEIIKVTGTSNIEL